MRGVADKKDAPGDQLAADDGVHLPLADRKHPPIEVLYADTVPDPRGAALRRVKLGRPLFRRHLELREPTSLGIERLEHAAGVFVGEEQQDAGTIADILLDIGP